MSYSPLTTVLVGVVPLRSVLLLWLLVSVGCLVVADTDASAAGSSVEVDSKSRKGSNPSSSSAAWIEKQGLEFLYGNETSGNKHELLRKTQALVHQSMERDRRIYFSVARRKFAHNKNKIHILQKAYSRQRRRRALEDNMTSIRNRERDRVDSSNGRGHLEAQSEEAAKAEGAEGEAPDLDISEADLKALAAADQYSITVEFEREKALEFSLHDKREALRPLAVSGEVADASVYQNVGRGVEDLDVQQEVDAVAQDEKSRDPEHVLDSSASSAEGDQHGIGSGYLFHSAKARSKITSGAGGTTNVEGSTSPVQDPNAYLKLQRDFPPGLVFGYKREHAMSVNGHDIVICGMDHLCIGSVCEYSKANMTSDGTFWLGQDSVTFYNKTRCPHWCECKVMSGRGLRKRASKDKRKQESSGSEEEDDAGKRGDHHAQGGALESGDPVEESFPEEDTEWKVAQRVDGCPGTIVPTRTIFLNRPMMSGHLGYGSRVNTWLRVTNLAIHVGHGFQLSQHSCPVEHRGQAHCFFQPASKCGTDFQTINSDGWVFEPDYWAVCRFLLGPHALREEMDVCSRDELYMYRRMARMVLKVQPDIDFTIRQTYFNDEQLRPYRWTAGVEAAGKAVGGEEGQGMTIIGKQVEKPDHRSPVVPVLVENDAPPAIRTSGEDQVVGVVRNEAELAQRVEKEDNNFFDSSSTQDTHTSASVLDTASSNAPTLASLPAFAGLHIRSTDNVGRFRHDVCLYADTVDRLLRFYRPDRKERERLLKTPGGWHNSLERLYEDGYVNPYSMHVKKKRQFSMGELLEGRYNSVDDYHAIEKRELKSRSGHGSKTSTTGAEENTETVGGDEEDHLRASRSTTTRKNSGDVEVEDEQNKEDQQRRFLSAGVEDGLGDDDVLPDGTVVSPLMQRNYSAEEQHLWKGEKTECVLHRWNVPTKVRTVFVATDNCTKLEDFRRCDAYQRNKWTLRSFCRREILKAALAVEEPTTSHEERTKTPMKKGRDETRVVEVSSADEPFLEATVSETSTNAKRTSTSAASNFASTSATSNFANRNAFASSELVDQLVQGEVDLSEAENIQHTARCYPIASGHILSEELAPRTCIDCGQRSCCWPRRTL
ncbi:unnamed protein product [Amoebophrya sp. A25]|nr:unnamed protein product [Amoebophrya sp. A25]|eukprot:GSA25T00022908001.1